LPARARLIGGGAEISQNCAGLLSPAETNTESLKQLSADENDIENVMNDAISDVAGVMSNGDGNLKSTAWLPCNSTVDSMAVVNDPVTMFIT